MKLLAGQGEIEQVERAEELSCLEENPILRDKEEEVKFVHRSVVHSEESRVQKLGQLIRVCKHGITC